MKLKVSLKNYAVLYDNERFKMLGTWEKIQTYPAKFYQLAASIME